MFRSLRGNGSVGNNEFRFCVLILLICSLVYTGGNQIGRIAVEKGRSGMDGEEILPISRKDNWIVLEDKHIQDFKEFVIKCETLNKAIDRQRNRSRKKIEDLDGEIAKSDMGIKESKGSIALKQEKLHQVQKENTDAKQEFSEIQQYQAELKHERELLKQACNREPVVLSKQDEGMLEKCRKKYELYKTTTGIRWDFSSDKHTVQGYVVNKSKNYVHPFTFKENAYESLWGEIAAAASCDWSDIGVIDEPE